MGQNKRKKKWERELLDSEQVDEQIRLRLSWLMIKDMEYDYKMRGKAIRLSRKRKKQADAWVI